MKPCELCGRPDCPTIPPPPPQPGAMLVGGGKVGEHVNFTAIADCRAAIRRNLAALQAAQRADGRTVVGEMKPDLIERARTWSASTVLLSECADALEAAQRAVAELPEYECSGGARCDKCRDANAKRLAARKAVGLEG